MAIRASACAFSSVPHRWIFIRNDLFHQQRLKSTGWTSSGQIPPPFTLIIYTFRALILGFLRAPQRVLVRGAYLSVFLAVVRNAACSVTKSHVRSPERCPQHLLHPNVWFLFALSIYVCVWHRTHSTGAQQCSYCTTSTVSSITFNGFPL